LVIIAVIQLDLINRAELGRVNWADWHIIKYCDVYTNTSESE